MSRFVQKAQHRGQRGAAVVELALVLPLLVMLMFGLISTGLAYTDDLAITNAAREGARLGSSTDYQATGWATSVRDRVKQVYFNESNSLTDQQVCVKLKSGSSATLASWSGSACASYEPADPVGPPDPYVGGTCLVKVWVAKPQKIELMVAPIMQFNIHAESVSFYGRKAGSCALP